MLEWIIDNAAFIHALATIILVGVTIAHIILNKRIIHSPHKSFVRPVKLWVDTVWKVGLKNFGPGLALNIKLRKLVTVKKKRILSKALKTTSKLRFADGPYELSADSDADYKYRYHMEFNTPFFLYWETITGYKTKSAWKLVEIESGGYKVEPVSVIEILRFWILYAAGAMKP